MIKHDYNSLPENTIPPKKDDPEKPPCLGAGVGASVGVGVVTFEGTVVSGTAVVVSEVIHQKHISGFLYRYR